MPTATPVGASTVTAIAERFIMPEIVDNVYGRNALLYRLNRSNKRIVRGGYQIEQPLMFDDFAAGGTYQGYDVLTVSPSDTIKNGAWAWAQYYVPVTVDGLTLIKVDSPRAIADLIRTYFAQAEMQMAQNLGAGIWSDGITNPKAIDGLQGAVDDGGVLGTYAGIVRASNTWWNANDDSTTSALTLAALQSMFMSCSSGGRHPTSIWSRVEQYNRYWNLNVANQDFPSQPSGHDEVLASAGFTNQLFNNVPWLIDDNVFDGPNASNSAIVMLNEDYMWLAVSPRADFVMQPFQQPVNQDAMTALMLWAGNLIITNCKRQGKLTNVSS